MDYAHAARHDLTRYLHVAPEASDADAMRERLVELSTGKARMH